MLQANTWQMSIKGSCLFFFFGKQAENYVIVDCLTGYVSLLLCKLILVVTVVIGLQIVTENSNK